MNMWQPNFLALDIVEVYVCYDRPLLFACQDPLDQKYLAVLSEEEEGEYEVWLYVAVSPRRFETVRSGGIDLYGAFKMPEAGVLHRVTINLPGDSTETTQIPAEEIKDEWLPKPDFRLNLPTTTLKKSPQRSAKESLREIVTLNFKFPGQLRTEAPAHVLGEVLTTFQNLVNQIAKSLLDSPAWFSVIGFAPGSFEIELGSDEEQMGLFRQSAAGDAMKEFVTLMEVREKPEQLATEIQRIGEPIIEPYLKFLNSFATAASEFEINWASPRQGYGGGVRLTELNALSIIEQVKQESAPTIKVHKVEGTLRGLSLEGKTFDLKTTENKKYHGRIAQEAIGSTVVQSAQINRQYVATIEEKVEKTVVSGKERPHNTLLNLSIPPEPRRGARKQRNIVL